MTDAGVRPRRYLIETWGCQMNQHDSEKMAGALAELGYESTPNDHDADIILLNTCSVRDKAESKVFDRLGRLPALLVELGDERAAGERHLAGQ